MTIQKFLSIYLALLTTQAAPCSGQLRSLVGINHANDPKTTIAKEKENTGSPLRFLFFGTSRTWGSIFQEQSPYSFTNRLDSNGTNLGVRGSNSDFPSLCVRSLLKDYPDEAYDVIILEFPGLPGVFKSTLWLAKRLRYRYPKAMIIFLDLWLLGSYTNGDGAIGIREWAKRNGFDVGGRSVVDPRLYQTFKVKTQSSEWKFSEEWILSSAQVKEIQNEVGGVVVRTPLPRDADQALQVFSNYFTNDFAHFTEAGNKYITNVINEKALSKFRTTHDSTLSPWDAIDDCQLWFRTGNVGDLHHNMELRRIKEGREKYALEATGETNWIEIINHHNQPIELKVEYMQTSPDCLYPDTKLSIVGSRVSTVVKCRKLAFPWEVHVTGQIKVGIVPSGESILKVEPLGPSQWPFRIVGIILSPVVESYKTATIG